MNAQQRRKKKRQLISEAKKELVQDMQKAGKSATDVQEALQAMDSIIKSSNEEAKARLRELTKGIP